MDGGSWKAAVHEVAEARTQLSDFTFTFHFHALEKEMATHSSVLAWRIPGTGEPGGLPSMGSHRIGHNWSDLAAVAAAEWILLHLMSPLSKFPSADPLILLAGYKSSAVFAIFEGEPDLSFSLQHFYCNSPE